MNSLNFQTEQTITFTRASNRWFKERLWVDCLGGGRRIVVLKEETSVNATFVQGDECSGMVMRGKVVIHYGCLKNAVPTRGLLSNLVFVLDLDKNHMHSVRMHPDDRESHIIGPLL